MNDSTSLESRFEGYDIMEAGVASIPNMLIKHYHRLGLSDGQFTLLCHLISRKWTKEPPFPSINGIPMSANNDTKRRYVRDLRHRGLLFTSRLYWTREDAEKDERVVPGRVRANLWYLGSLFHNLVRMDKWIEARKPEKDFRVELPLITVRMFLEGKFHDTPPEIIQAIMDQTKGGTVIKAVTLLCENDIVAPTVRNSSSRNSSTRKSHRLKEESDSNKNQTPNKNQDTANAAPPVQPSLSTEFTLEPDTPEALLVFEKIKQNQRARGQSGNAKRFKSIEQKKKFLAAVTRLGPAFEQALTDGLEKGITDLAGLVGWLTGCKADGKKKKTAQDSAPLFPPPDPAAPEPEKPELTPEELILAEFKERASQRMRRDAWETFVQPLAFLDRPNGKIRVACSPVAKDWLEKRLSGILDPIAQELAEGGFEYVVI